MEGGTLPPYIIHPFSMEYRIWLYLTCVAAAWTGEGLGSQTGIQLCLTQRAQLNLYVPASCVAAGQHCALIARHALVSQSTSPGCVQVSMSRSQYPSCKSLAHSKQSAPCLPMHVSKI